MTGQQAYEQDLKICPMYPGNHGQRPAWADLPEIAKWSWNRNPTVRSENEKENH